MLTTNHDKSSIERVFSDLISDIQSTRGEAIRGLPLFYSETRPYRTNKGRKVSENYAILLPEKDWEEQI